MEFKHLASGPLVRKSLCLLLAVAELYIIVWQVRTEDLSWIPMTLGLIAVFVLVMLWWPYGAFLALIAASAMPRFFVTIHGWRARPAHVVVGIVLAVAVVRLLFKKAPGGLVALDYVLILYVVLNYASSAFMSPDPSKTMRWALLNNLAVLPYFLIRLFVAHERTLHKVFKLFLAVGLAEAAYGIACFMSHQFLGTTFGEEMGQYGWIPGTYGTQYEANLFGSYSGCVAAMFLALYLFDRRRPRWYVAGFAVAFLAMALSLARAALLGFAVPALFLFYLAHKRTRLRFRKLLPVFLVGTVLFLAILPLAGGFLAQRFGTVELANPAADADTGARLATIVVAFEDIAHHPYLGNGTASFQLLENPNPGLGDRPWVGNAPVRILHDAGLAGLITLLWFAVLLLKTVRNGLVKKDSEEYPILVALLAGALLYAVTFLATDGTMLSFTWVHVGLLMSAAMIAQAGSAPSREAPRPAS